MEKPPDNYKDTPDCSCYLCTQARVRRDGEGRRSRIIMRHDDSEGTQGSGTVVTPGWFHTDFERIESSSEQQAQAMRVGTAARMENLAMEMSTAGAITGRWTSNTEAPVVQEPLTFRQEEMLREPRYIITNATT